MTANVISAGTDHAQTNEPVPVIAPVDPADDGSLLTDSAMGRAGIFGFLLGTVVMTVLCFLFGLLAGIDASTALAVAPVPGVVAGLFFGMTAFIGVYIAQHGH